MHGDFRNGNFVVGPEGIRAVLDWELSHLGDPLEDLGWLCVRAWRFRNDDRPAGGFGTREELYAAYEEASGRAVDPEVVGLKVVGETFSEEPYGVGVPLEDTALRMKINDILQQSVENGTWQQNNPAPLGRAGAPATPPQINRY